MTHSNGTQKRGTFHDVPSGTDSYAPAAHASLSKGGYAACWPTPAGNFAVFPMGSQRYSLSVGLTTNTLHSFVSGRDPYRNYLELGINPPREVIKAGSVIRAKFLFVLDDGTDAPADFNFIRRACGLAGPPAYKVVLGHGRVLGTTYTLTLQAKNYYVRGNVSKAKLPNHHLGVIVKGLNGNWDAGIYDTKADTLRRVGIYRGAAYVLLNTRQANDFIIGNLAYASRAGVRLTVLKFDRHGLTVVAQNPTDKVISVVVGSLFSVQHKTCRLPAGGTATVHLLRR